MLKSNNSWFSIYFGARQDAIYPAYYLNLDTTDSEILKDSHFKNAKDALGMKHLAFLHQVHGAQGMLIKSAHQIAPFKTDGDYIITHLSGFGIGVMSADCLPIVFCDNKNKVIAVAHAGWRGSVQKIAPVVIGKMQEEYATQLDDITIFLGPSAQSCCYEVDDQFQKNFSAFRFANQLFTHKNEKIYFNLPLFNQLQLQEVGILLPNIRLEYNLCTMCDHNFFSYRKDGEAAGRQMTVVAIKN